MIRPRCDVEEVAGNLLVAAPPNLGRRSNAGDDVWRRPTTGNAAAELRGAISRIECTGGCKSSPWARWSGRRGRGRSYGDGIRGRTRWPELGAGPRFAGFRPSYHGPLGGEVEEAPATGSGRVEDGSGVGDGLAGDGKFWQPDGVALLLRAFLRWKMAKDQPCRLCRGGTFSRGPWINPRLKGVFSPGLCHGPRLKGLEAFRVPARYPHL